jgi:hypothetical protein
LTITDLRHDVASRCGLDLAIGDLGDDVASGGSLNLAIGDLRNYGDRGSSSGSLDLAIRNLRDGSGGNLRLAIADLRGAGTRAHVDSLDVDLGALSALRVGVQVVEVSGQTLEEGGGTGCAGTRGKSQRAVAAEGEALGLQSTSLDGSVELEPSNN